ncbi:hypothetical protein IQ06DRAFT_90424 [Phaeosphaeriaceae sp. SRC1lsM3a]|nr:hypothetical protein IQ06DRAFT_90424 [Stagonospora sp. SRC1lsM3a]
MSTTPTINIGQTSAGHTDSWWGCDHESLPRRHNTVGKPRNPPYPALDSSTSSVAAKHGPWLWLEQAAHKWCCRSAACQCWRVAISLGVLRSAVIGLVAAAKGDVCPAAKDINAAMLFIRLQAEGELEHCCARRAGEEGKDICCDAVDIA